MKFGLFFLTFLLTIFTNFINAQNDKSINIQLIVYTTGTTAELYKEQFENYLQNELLKIPDVKLSEDENVYVLFVSVFEIPCECKWFDYHYTARFFSIKSPIVYENNEIAQAMPLMEGYKAYNEIENLSKDIISSLNTGIFNWIRNN
jgi:hypothetical protein